MLFPLDRRHLWVALLIIVFSQLAAGAQELNAEEFDRRVVEAQKLANQQSKESQTRALEEFLALDKELMDALEPILQQPESQERERALVIASQYRTNIVGGQAMVYSQMREPEKAVAALKQILPFLEQHGDPMSKGLTYKNLADIYKNFSQPAEAWEYYQKALEILPEDDFHRSFVQFARLGASQALEALGRSEEALSLLNKVESSAADFSDVAMQQKMLKYAYFNRGYFFLRLGQFQKAKADMEALLALPMVQEDPGERFVASLALMNLTGNQGYSEERRRYVASAESAIKELDPSEISPDNLFLFLLSKGSQEIKDGKVVEGLAMLEQAEKVHRDAGYGGLSSAFYIKFSTYHSMGRGAELLPAVEAHFAELQEPTSTDLNLLQLYSSVLATSGKPDEALEQLERLLHLLEERGARVAMMDCLESMGDIYYTFELSDKARACYELALDIAVELDNPERIALMKGNIWRAKLGQPYYLKDDEQVYQDMVEVIRAYQQVEDVGGLATVLSSYVFERIDSHEYETARTVLNTLRANSGGVSDTMDSYILFAESLIARALRDDDLGPGLLSRLNERVEQGRPLERQLLREILAWRTVLGRDLSEGGVLERFEGLGDELESSSDRAYNLVVQALLAHEDGRTRDSLELLSLAEELLWTSRDSSSRQGFRAAHSRVSGNLYGLTIRYQLEENDKDAAFLAAERARGQALAALFSLGDQNLMATADPSQRAKLTRLYVERDELEKSLLSRTNDSKQLLGDLERNAHEIDQLLSDVAFSQTRDVAGRIRREVASLQEVQKALKPKQAMVYYYVGLFETYLFVIAPDREVQVAVLPDGFELMDKVATLRDAVFRGDDTTEMVKTLSELLLPKVDLSGYSEVVVVPDGPLYLFPFGVLLSKLRPTVLPSATSLVELKKREATKSAEITVMADPLYSDRASEVRGDSVHLGSLSRLPGTAREANIVKELATARGYQVDIHLGAAASRQKLFEKSESGELRKSRIVHFATHGFFAPKDIKMSGLVLSTVDQEGNLVNGYLRLLDIYKLDLDAELVVLSACQTGRGTIREGEGLQGLYQGFLLAGGRTVLNTLWSVDDAGTAAFMQFFYGSLMEGRSPKEALSDAQQKMATSDLWSDPLYWAGFQLVSP